MRTESTLSGFEMWMVQSNINRISDGNLNPAEVVAELRANGYNRVADAVEAATS